MAEATPLANAYPLMAQNSYLAKASRDRGPLGMMTPSFGLQGAPGQPTADAAIDVPTASQGAAQVPTNFVSNGTSAFRSAFAAQQSASTAAGMVASVEILGQAALGGALLLACLLNGPRY